ncbi:hypothetical protein [Aquabacterium sp. OR-4]|uniref:hypothetical protein n=1 Tax=Aquabacterium sp. OR-4 TaxID=2978127 RepID=UPI0028C6FA63|nr:hypothetical protein [Aquabacterium sp. OR-4]MDT7838907.1 hypothetical protein [Aquabacterium sp. OR-4]
MLAGAVLLGAGVPAQAALLVTPTGTSIELAPGALSVVRGDITNTTGFDLGSGDLFGSFSGYPSNALIIEQLLGLVPLSIDDRAITRDLELFSVQLGSGALPGQTYTIEFFFGDVNGSFSEVATYSVTVAQGHSIPEPGMAWLAGISLLGLAAGRRRGSLRGAQEI